MAKTTSTTKAKTKTTKRKATTKTAAKTTKAAAKTTRPAKATAAKSKKARVAAAAPAAKTNGTKVTIRRNDGRFAFLRRPQVRLGLLFTALAVAAGLLMNRDSAQVLLGHLSKDELASRAGTVLAPAASPLYEVEFRWLLVGTLAVAAVLAFLRGTRYFAREEVALGRRVQGLRWVNYAIVFALLFGIVALMNGIQDVVALKLSMAFVALSAAFSWMFERENAVTGRPARASYNTAQIAVALPLVMLAATMIGTIIFGLERSPWYAYAAALVIAVGLIATVRSQWGAFLKRNGAHDFPFVARSYERIYGFTVVVLSVVLIVGQLDK